MLSSGRKTFYNFYISAQCENGTIKCEKKKRGTTEYDKSTVTCDISTAQCEDIKCEKKVRELPNIRK